MMEILSYKGLGDLLLNLCRAASSEVILAAPFIKRDTLSRIVSAVPDGVTIRCVTRWIPYEVAAGVSDVEVWPLLNHRPNSSLWLRQDLHAKYYRIDNDDVVGSANISNAALGWSNHPNLELLLLYRAGLTEASGFESALWKACVQVNQDIYECVKTAASALEPYLPKPELDNRETSIFKEDDDLESVSPNTDRGSWTPLSRHPEQLFKLYSGESSSLTEAALVSASQDLKYLAIPLGLNEEAFNKVVGAMLLQQYVVQQVDSFVITPQRFGAVSAFLRSLDRSYRPEDSKAEWQLLMRWLLWFLPERYERTVPRHSEVFARRT